MKREKAIGKAQLNFDFNKSHYIRSVFLDDDAYPFPLKECKDGPIQLNVLGQICRKNKTVLSIVGTRKCSTNSEQIINQLIAYLTGLDIIVLSGIARH